jgi:hypothetical protein
MNRFFRSGVALFSLMLLAGFTSTIRAEWQVDDKTLAWKNGDRTIWSFSFDPSKGKAYFEPLTVNGGAALTSFRPVDHPHHYALWFSWKYINQTNYWEEQAETSGGVKVSAGKTSWNPPVIETRPDGSATIRLALTYASRTKARVDMMENREIIVSAPAADGSYTIDWRAQFMAGPDGAFLDRTPMPGEPRGAVNGGYAGFSIRMASPPLGISYLSTEKVITEWPGSRSRPNAPAVASNFSENSKEVGAVAILSDPKNAGENAPWYLINQGEMRFMCAAILAPKPRQMAPGEQFTLNYRVALRPTAWTPESLAAAHREWLKELAVWEVTSEPSSASH